MNDNEDIFRNVTLITNKKWDEMMEELHALQLECDRILVDCRRGLNGTDWDLAEALERIDQTARALRTRLEGLEKPI